MFPKTKLKLILRIFALNSSSQKPSTKRLLTSFSILTIIGVFVNIIYGFSLDVFGDGFIVSSLATSIVYISVVIGHITAVLESLVKREEHNEFYEKLHELDDIFRFKLTHMIPVAGHRRKITRKYCAIGFVVYLSLCLYIGSILSHKYEGFFWYGIISVVVSRMRFIQASIYVDLVNLRFHHLNLLLEQIDSCRLQRKYLMLDVDYCVIDNPKRILVIKSIYRKLHDLVSCLNDVFGWSVLTLTVYYCLDFTCNCYWLILASDQYLASYHNYECFFTIIPIGLLMTSYCYVCSECNRMVKFITIIF